MLFAASGAPELNLDVSVAMWAGLGLIIIVMAAFDLVIYARGHVPSVRENTIWSIGWIAIALLFGAAFWAWQGAEAGSQYMAGYLIERSLSLDNIFVFAVILSYFAVPEQQTQAKVLAWGIILALVLRLSPVVQRRVCRPLASSRAARGRGVERAEVLDLTQQILLLLFDRDSRVLRSWDPARGLSLDYLFVAESCPGCGARVRAAALPDTLAERSRVPRWVRAALGRVEGATLRGFSRLDHPAPLRVLDSLRR